MNLMNSSSFLKRISRLAIQFVGGLVAMLNSPTCFGLLRTFSASLVVYSIVIDGFMTNVVVLGSAVAVERVFSGGHDTISLRHASLQPETIKALMLVKKSFILHTLSAQLPYIVNIL